MRITMLDYVYETNIYYCRKVVSYILLQSSTRSSNQYTQ